MIRHYAVRPTSGAKIGLTAGRPSAFDHSIPRRARFTRSDAVGELALGNGNKAGFGGAEMRTQARRRRSPRSAAEWGRLSCR